MNQTDRLSDAPRPDPPVDPLVTARLSDEQLELLGKRGAAEETHRGQVLFHEGDRSYDFIVILAGTVNVVDHQAGAERVLATGGAGDFVAELSILTGERLFTTAVVEEPGSILVVPVDELQLAIGEDQFDGRGKLFARHLWKLLGHVLERCVADPFTRQAFPVFNPSAAEATIPVEDQQRSVVNISVHD